MLVFKNTIALIRHGETEWNLQMRTQGHLDSPLTEKGILQAKKIVRKLKNQKFDIVISSPLGRAVQTSKIISKELQIPKIIMDECFAERNLGALQGCNKEESTKLFPHFWDANGRFIQNSKIPEAESIDDFLHRVKKGINNLQLISETKNIIMVTHDGVLHAIVGHVKGIEFGDVQKFYTFDHCEPFILG